MLKLVYFTSNVGTQVVKKVRIVMSCCFPSMPCLFRYISLVLLLESSCPYFHVYVHLCERTAQSELYFFILIMSDKVFFIFSTCMLFVYYKCFYIVSAWKYLFLKLQLSNFSLRIFCTETWFRVFNRNTSYRGIKNKCLLNVCVGIFYEDVCSFCFCHVSGLIGFPI